MKDKIKEIIVRKSGAYKAYGFKSVEIRKGELDKIVDDLLKLFISQFIDNDKTPVCTLMHGVCSDIGREENDCDGCDYLQQLRHELFGTMGVLVVIQYLILKKDLFI
jgi:hypothetical protein